jgi:hypothetical protein
MNCLIVVESRGVTYLLFQILKKQQLILHAILPMLSQSFILKSRILFLILISQSTISEIINYPIFQTKYKIKNLLLMIFYVIFQNLFFHNNNKLFVHSTYLFLQNFILNSSMCAQMKLCNCVCVCAFIVLLSIL